MAKKKLSKREPKRKVMIAEVARQELGEMNEGEQLTALQVLEATQGWQIIVKNITDNIELLDRQILEKMNDDGEPLTDLDCDRLRDKRGYLREIGTTPQTIMARLKMSVPGIDNGDPYPKSVNDLIEMRNA
jgi:hypothetical protein